MAKKTEVLNNEFGNPERDVKYSMVNYRTEKKLDDKHISHSLKPKIKQPRSTYPSNRKSDEAVAAVSKSKGKK